MRRVLKLKNRLQPRGAASTERRATLEHKRLREAQLELLPGDVQNQAGAEPGRGLAVTHIQQPSVTASPGTPDFRIEPNTPCAQPVY
jgi:hypothetical protein